jgi:hypothetical protein
MTNGSPDYKAMFDGRNSNPSGWPFAKDFGILVSPPLRIQIVKANGPEPMSGFIIDTNLLVPFSTRAVKP